MRAMVFPHFCIFCFCICLCACFSSVSLLSCVTAIGIEFGIEFEGDERFVIIERFVRINRQKGPAEREKNIKKGMVVLEVNEESTR